MTLFAAGRCRTMARQVTYLEEAPTEHMGTTLYDAYHVGQAYRDVAAQYDVVHDHAGFLGPAFASLIPQPVVHTLHGPFIPETCKFYEAFKDDCYYVAISHSRNGVRPGPQLPRGGPQRGGHRGALLQGHRGRPTWSTSAASARTRESNRLSSWRRRRASASCLRVRSIRVETREYFDSRVRPHVDGERVVYLGEVSSQEKVRALQHARAFIFPIQWEEPFGLVMVEAMACGTRSWPRARGPCPRWFSTVSPVFSLIPRRSCWHISTASARSIPLACRRAVEERFSPEVMAASYVDIYRRALEIHPIKLQPLHAHTA